MEKTFIFAKVIKAESRHNEISSKTTATMEIKKFDYHWFDTWVLANAILFKKQLNMRKIIRGIVIVSLICSCGDSKNEKANNIQKESESYEVSTTTLPFMNEFQKQLRDLYYEGKITKTQFKYEIDKDNSVYADLFITMNLSDYELYTDAYNDDGSNSLEIITDGRKRQEIRDRIIIAIREDRVMWQAAISGDDLGTYIIVIPKADDGEIKGTNRGMIVFIPRLFENSVKNAFDCVDKNVDSIKRKR